MCTKNLKYNFFAIFIAQGIIVSQSLNFSFHFYHTLTHYTMLYKNLLLNKKATSSFNKVACVLLCVNTDFDTICVQFTSNAYIKTDRQIGICNAIKHGYLPNSCSSTGVIVFVSTSYPADVK